MSSRFLKIEDQSQVDIVLMEAFPALFQLKKKYGEDFVIDFIETFGGVDVEVPTIDHLKELVHAYYDQNHFKKFEKKKTFKSAISSIKSNNSVKSPSEIYRKLKKMSQRFSPECETFFDFYYKLLKKD